MAQPRLANHGAKRDATSQRRLGCDVFVFLVMLFFTPMCLANDPVSAIRFATYNVSLYGDRAGEVARRLEAGTDRQARNLASVIQSVRPDVLLLNEVDHESDARTLDQFVDKYLAVDQAETTAIQYAYRYTVPSNTGLASNLDLDGDGNIGGANDAWGYGHYPGQYAMAVLSRYPIDKPSIRSFQTFRWSHLPNALRPIDPKTGSSYYRDDVWSALRLSSKNHVDVPILVNGTPVHLLASHPTPPVFDGADDHNGCRNHDEIRFWSEYLQGEMATFLVDDAGVAGGLPHHALFVIAGDMNADPVHGDGRREAIERLLAHPRVTDAKPMHVLPEHPSPAERASVRLTTTAAFGRQQGLRVDYVLPSQQMAIRDAGVFWPGTRDPRHHRIAATDHRLVWVEVTLP